MSFYAEAGKIEITDSLENIKFTTNDRLLQIHSTYNSAYTVPAITGASSYTPFDISYTITNAFSYSANFIIGYAIFNTLKYAINGAILLGTGFMYPGIPTFSDTVAFYPSGRNLVLHRKGFTGFNANIPQQTLTFLIYAGNYDL